MARPCHSRAWTRVFAFLWIIVMEIAAHGIPIQNSSSTIADLREKALSIPLQTPVHVSLHIVRQKISHLFSGRLTEVTEKGIKVLVRGESKVEMRELSYEDIRSFQIDHAFRHPKRSLQNKLFEVEEGSLVDLRLKSGEKVTGVIQEYLDESLVFRVRAADMHDSKEIPLSMVKSFSVKSRAQSAVLSDPKAFELLREASTSTSVPEVRAKQDDPTTAIPVILRLKQTVSTVDAMAGDQVDFEIVTDVKIRGQAVLIKGGSAWGKVVDVVEKRRAGRSAQVHFAAQFARTPAGEVLPLSAVQHVKGGGQTAKVVTEMAVLGFVFVPLAPLGLLSHGSDTAIAKGTLVIAYLQPFVPACRDFKYPRSTPPNSIIKRSRL